MELHVSLSRKAGVVLMEKGFVSLREKRGHVPDGLSLGPLLMHRGVFDDILPQFLVVPPKRSGGLRGLHFNQ